MRREDFTTKKSNPLWDFLQAHNCSFYSPLSQDDTSDWISGNPMQQYASGSVLWDGNINMWKFTYVSGQPNDASQYYAKWTLHTPTPNGASRHFTALAELYPYSNGAYTADQHNNYDLLPTRAALSMLGNVGQVNNSGQVWETLNSVTKMYMYKNGTYNLNYNYGSDIVCPTSSEIRIGCNVNSQLRKQYAMRNFAFFFGTVLEKTEIDEYFNLI